MYVDITYDDSKIMLDHVEYTILNAPIRPNNKSPV